MKNLVVPELFVDIGSEIQTKENMLRCHASQKNWLDVSQGQDSYLATMRDICAEIAALSKSKAIQHAEGFRRHNPLGFSAEDKDLLSEVLKSRVKKAK